MAVAPFREIERSYFDLRWHLDPVGATQAGVKTYDDRYGRFGPSALAPHLAALKALAAALEETTADQVEDEIDRTALLNEIRVTLRRFERERPQAKNPGFWLSHLLGGLHFLLGRRDRSPEERAVSVAGRLEDVPRLLDDARAALVEPVRVFVETALRVNEGGLSLVREVGAGLGERGAGAVALRAASQGRARIGPGGPGGATGSRQGVAGRRRAAARRPSARERAGGRVRGRNGPGARLRGHPRPGADPRRSARRRADAGVHAPHHPVRGLRQPRCLLARPHRLVLRDSSRSDAAAERAGAYPARPLPLRARRHRAARRLSRPPPPSGARAAAALGHPQERVDTAHRRRLGAVLRGHDGGRGVLPLRGGAVLSARAPAVARRAHSARRRTAYARHDVRASGGVHDDAPAGGPRQCGSGGAALLRRGGLSP